MATFIALLRAVNVGGTGKLAMADLRRLCAEAGFRNAVTLLASGNAVFDADGDEEAISAALEARLAAHCGRPVPILIRTAAELENVLAASPFKTADPARVICVAMPSVPAEGWRAGIRGRADEEIESHGRHLLVHYPSGQGVSRIVIPAAATGTGRNLATVKKLCEIARLRG